MHEFFNMGGHGPYIWPAYLVSLIALGALYFSRRAALRREEARDKRETDA
ncbi:MAG: heme exporter protein CcmD [Pseudomonadota bacterium]